MNDLPRQKLPELLAQHGPALCDDARRCKALLREQCGAYKQEIRVLLDTLTEAGVIDALRAATPDAPREELLTRLSRQVQEAADLPEEEARWGVESWALALDALPRDVGQVSNLPGEAADCKPVPQTSEATAKPQAAAAADIDQPSSFYLGREYDLAAHSVLPDRTVTYDARDLLTHGVVVGMTGSGKTGLCINIIEEAAIDGIPCIIIDPKGDLTNLLLQFPALRPEDFLPWVNPEDARQKGVKLEEYAGQLAETWRKGLAEWGQSPERIARLRDSSEFRIYTPGSEAGLPLSILQTFAAPKGTVTREALNQKIDATTTALLGLTGIVSDPVQSREHILIAQLLLQAWSKGRDIDLPQLIGEIQAPSLRKIGTLDVDTFYPEKERLKLAVALNNILASPSFSTWITGEPLDLGRMLAAPGGKPRQLIFYVAHLDDAQRLFFIALLLEEVLSWTRKQAGTTSLRAILYFDEVFGYLPPHPANPPTKGPLMALLKQARAFGLGVLLATQNPVDLDYKALSNAGTWFVGKLQTERDKARLLEGLEGVAAERGTLSNRAHLETVISALGNRVFLLHDVHRSEPILFQSRWALSFLRGPIMPDQLHLLTDRFRARPQEPAGAVPLAIPLCPRCQAALPGSGMTVCPNCGAMLPQGAPAEKEPRQTPLHSATEPAASASHVAPVLAGVTQFYIPLSSPARPAGAAELVYQPRLLAFAEVTFGDRRRKREHRRACHLLAVPPPGGQPVDWHAAEPYAGATAAGPEASARWSDVPESLNTAKKLKALERVFTDFLYGNEKLTLWENVTLGLVSEPDETEQAFRERCRRIAGVEASRVLADARERYAPRFKELDADLPEEKSETKQGGSWFPEFLSPFTWASPPAKPNLSAKDRKKLDKLEKEWQGVREEIARKYKQAAAECTAIQLTPRRNDVSVTQFGLAWVPFWGTVAAYR
jgi:hypothetical protein